MDSQWVRFRFFWNSFIFFHFRLLFSRIRSFTFFLLTCVSLWKDFWIKLNDIMWVKSFFFTLVLVICLLFFAESYGSGAFIALRLFLSFTRRIKLLRIDWKVYTFVDKWSSGVWSVSIVSGHRCSDLSPLPWKNILAIVLWGLIRSKSWIKIEVFFKKFNQVRKNTFFHRFCFCLTVFSLSVSFE